MIFNDYLETENTVFLLQNFEIKENLIFFIFKAFLIYSTVMNSHYIKQYFQVPSKLVIMKFN